MIETRIYPVITLYQPWATWIMRGWKTIETRTHDRFKSLKGKTILIHAGQRTDESAVNNPYLTRSQILYNPDEIINGHILGAVRVWSFRELTEADGAEALIECKTQRFGLELDEVTRLETPIRCKGELGIWYFDIRTGEKVKKPELLKLF